MTDRLRGIPTNIITGFLGAGKSTAILKLLNSKPSSERWAVLVNEFGEVGIDGGLLDSADDGKVFIKEVPGGCMCCTAGLPMQMALNMLIARSRPDRLIIEPTGLGHPFEVVNVLSSEHYSELLDIRSTLTLVDARKIRDQRYTSHATFNEQLEIGDIIVASKYDLCEAEDFERLKSYLEAKTWLDDRMLVTSVQGDLDRHWLEQPATNWRAKPAAPLPSNDESHDDGHNHAPEPEFHDVKSDEVRFPPEGYVRLSNNGEGFVSHGWIFDSSFTFERQQLKELLHRTKAERIKALIHTNGGDIGYNFSGDAIEELALKPLVDSRIEIIAAVDFEADEFEQRLLATSTSV